MNTVTLHSQPQVQEDPLQCALNPSKEPGKLSPDFVTLFISEIILQIHAHPPAGFIGSPSLGEWVNSPHLVLLFQQHWSLGCKYPGNHRNFSFMQSWISLHEYLTHLATWNCAVPAPSHTAGASLALTAEFPGSLKYSFYNTTSEKNTVSTSDFMSDLSIPWSLFKSGAKQQHLQHPCPYQLVNGDILSRILGGRLNFPLRNFLLLLDYFITDVCNSTHLLRTSLILCTRYVMKWLKRGKLVHSRKPEEYRSVELACKKLFQVWGQKTTCICIFHTTIYLFFL